MDSISSATSLKRRNSILVAAILVTAPVYECIHHMRIEIPIIDPLSINQLRQAQLYTVSTLRFLIDI